MVKERGESNELIHETSPYLLQHAWNPVKWVPFAAEAFERAANENKLVLVSVGYSACHWCHVMEHESFEDTQVAEVMNRHFVSIKVDREERADVDMLYMQAVQLMTGHGGWPLNCFVLPDGRPFYGGTYFNKDQWLQVLTSLADLHQKQPEKISEYAAELTNGIHRAEAFITQVKQDEPVTSGDLKISVDRWRGRFDHVNGGPDKSPKFPLPSNYNFLLHYAILAADAKVRSHVELTLTRMAYGGIFDHVHGGFARYSTDMIWKVPHFEKMLYDNAQLASLYLQAYILLGNRLYKKTGLHIIDFVLREWQDPAGGFYSAYDADSEGEEGKFYVWEKKELRDILREDYDVFSQYFEINEKGYWENGNYILMRNPDEGQVTYSSAMGGAGLEEIIDRSLGKLKEAAATRTKPGLDDKCITAWNAMMCTALSKAWLVTGEQRYRAAAIRGLDFIRTKLVAADGHLLRTYKQGKAKVTAFLDDYVFFVEALITCYQATAKEEYLTEALARTEEAWRLFENKESLFFYYTSEKGEKLIARNTETSDNVIPSSNAQMANNLFLLAQYFERPEWTDRARGMLAILKDEIVQYGGGYSGWGSLALMLTYPLREVVIVGKDVEEKTRQLFSEGLTNAILAVSAGPSQLPLLRDRYVEGKTMIYVCRDKTCGMPVEDVREALLQLD